VVALGDIAAGECARHDIEHTAVCHPSRRGYTNAKNAAEIADAITALGFKGIEKPGLKTTGKSNSRNGQLWKICYRGEKSDRSRLEASPEISRRGPPHTTPLPFIC
jgi:hypothetical protein